MPIDVQSAASGALLRRCRELQDATRPGSRVQSRFRAELRQVVLDDHTDMLLRGVDRYGTPRAPLAESTLADPRRGPGPSLIPRGVASRFITNFEAAWKTVNGAMVLACGFKDILSKKGVSIVRFHLDGAIKPGTSWVLPRRDVSGISPKGWSAVKSLFARLPDAIRRSGGGR